MATINSGKSYKAASSHEFLRLENTPSPSEIRGSATTLPDVVQVAIKRASDLSIYSLEQINNTTQWVVGVSPNRDPLQLAQTLNASLLGSARFLGHAFILEFSPEDDPVSIAELIRSQSDVEFYYPLVQGKASSKLVPNDPLYIDQWHLKNTGQTVFGFAGTAGEDANLEPAWDTATGNGVVIGIVDEGVDYNHPDLAPGYRSDLDFDYIDNDNDPAPVFPSEDHGTAVAGVAAARGNNGIGVSGSGLNASIAGLRAATLNDATDSGALSHAPQDIHIYNNSWGPTDDPASFGLTAPGPMTTAALLNGITNGRGGLGSIYVWSAGNGLADDDDVNYDGYANSRFTIAVGAIDFNGEQTFYSEPGAAMLITAPSGGTPNVHAGITTTDQVGASGYNVNGLGGYHGTGDYSDFDYTNSFNGTSSAAPLVAGVIALMLEVNPGLTWRDVQHILVETARQNDPTDADWAVNGASYHINHKYGFGAIDAGAVVATAASWTNVGPEVSFDSGTINVNAAIPDNNPTGLTRTFNVPANINIESVEVVFNAPHTHWPDLDITLTSPSGTQSRLAEAFTPSSLATTGYSNWTFSTVRNWGESSLGTWTLQVSDEVAMDTGTWNSWGLRIFGTDLPDEALVADLGITKTDGLATVDAGAPITYTITATNAGPDTAAGVTITDTFPAILQNPTWTSSTGGASGVDPSGTGPISDTVTMPIGSAITYTVIATVAPNATDGTIITNTAVISPPSGVSDPVLTNNTGPDTTTVSALADLTITKTDSPDPVPTGGTLNYTLTVKNEGGKAATDIVVKDTLPSGFTFGSTTVSSGFTANQSGGIVTFSGGSLTPGQSATLTITGTAPGNTGTLTNTAVVDPDNKITESNENNNTATASTTMLSPSTPGTPGTPGTPTFPGFPPPFVPPALTPTIEPPPSNPLPPIYLSTITSNNFRGTEKPETIYGGPFDDTIDGAGGNDTIYAQSGNDLIVGGNGSDKLFGNQGDDRLYGGDGDDTIYGGKDNDFINGERGHDRLRGDLGNDTVRGGDGDDTIYGGKGNDALLGDRGDDYLSGDLGDDTLDGVGRDRESVGEIDTLVGGEGANLFVLGTPNTVYYNNIGPGAGYGDYALIEDFNASQDRLQLKGGVPYLLNFSPNGLPGGTGIYIDDGSTPGTWDEEDELIAVLKDIAPNDSLFSRMNFV